MRIAVLLCRCWKAFFGVFLLLATLFSPYAKGETLTLGGVGSLTPLVKLLGTEYARQNPSIDIRVIEPPMGGGGALRAISTGKIDIALTGRPAKPEEGGQTRPWLRTPLVLATNAGKSKGFSRAEIADIYAGRLTTWDDKQPIRTVLRGSHESESIAFRTLSPAVDAAVGVALTRSGVPIAENDLEALDLLGKINGSLGTTSLGLLKSTGARLTVLAIDGVQPSARSLEEGAYPLQRQYYLVLSGSPRPAAIAFSDWLQSPAALAAARKLDYLPLK